MSLKKIYLSSCAPLECCANCRHQRVLRRRCHLPLREFNTDLTTHWSLCSPFISIANLPAYDVRNEQCVHTAGIFSCNSSSFYSLYNNTGRRQSGTYQASATCRASSTSTAAAVLWCPRRDCAGNAACIETLHPSLMTRSVVCSDAVTLWCTIDSDSIV